MHDSKRFEIKMPPRHWRCTAAPPPTPQAHPRRLLLHTCSLHRHRCAPLMHCPECLATAPKPLAAEAEREDAGGGAGNGGGHQDELGRSAVINRCTDRTSWSCNWTEGLETCCSIVVAPASWQRCTDCPVDLAQSIIAADPSSQQPPVGTTIMQLTSLLQAAQSPDAGVRNQAEQTLTSLQQGQYAELCVGLSAELADSSKPVDARRLAGLILKNTLDAKEEARKVGPAGRARSLGCSRPVWGWQGCRGCLGLSRGSVCIGLAPLILEGLLPQPPPLPRRRHPPTRAPSPCVSVLPACCCCLLQAALVQQWLSMDAGMKKHVKQNLLDTLGTQVCFTRRLNRPARPLLACAAAQHCCFVTTVLPPPLLLPLHRRATRGTPPRWSSPRWRRWSSRARPGPSSSPACLPTSRRAAARACGSRRWSRWATCARSWATWRTTT